MPSMNDETGSYVFFAGAGDNPLLYTLYPM
jgi:hypothetical protein